MRRKILCISIVLLLLWVTPVLATSQFLIWINNIPHDTSITWKDGQIYVPVRLVAEKLNCDVKYTGYSLEIKSRLTYPVFQGDEKFKNTCTQAMQLLKENDPVHYKMICDNVNSYFVYDDFKEKDPNFLTFARCQGKPVMINPKWVADKTFVPERVAGVLVHEASHASSYGLYGDKIVASDTPLADKENEIIAYEHELCALKLIGAPQWTIDQVKASITYRKLGS